MNLNFYDTLAELVDAATSDRELELIAAAATAVAAPQLASDLRDVRDQKRAVPAAPTMTDEQLLVRSVMDLGVAELITHRTTNEEIDGYVVAAEAGAGGPLFGLQAELTRLRDAEHREWRRQVDAAKERLRKEESYTRIDPDDPFCPATLREKERRVFVGAAFGGPVSVHAADPAPRIANVGEAGRRHAYGYHLPEPANVAPRIATLGETAEERRRIDQLKSQISVEDL